jgi:hypothetical protein
LRFRKIRKIHDFFALPQNSQNSWFFTLPQNSWFVLRFRKIRKIPKSDYQLRYICPACPSVRPRGKTRLRLDRIFIQFCNWVFFEKPVPHVWLLRTQQPDVPVYTGIRDIQLQNVAPDGGLESTKHVEHLMINL